MKPLKIAKKSAFYLLLILLAFIFCLPLGYAIYNSLLPLDKVNTLASITDFTLDYYVELFTTRPVWRWLSNTVLMAVFTLLGQLTTSLLGGYALAKLRFPGRKIVYTIVLITLMIPFQVLLTPLYITVAKLKWVNTITGLTVPFLMNSLYIFMARQFFVTLPDDLIEAARIDGLGHAGTFFRIALPMAKSIIVTIIIFNFTQSWNAYLVPSTFSTTEEHYTLVVGLNTLKDTYFNRTNLTMAGVVVITLPVLVLFLFLQKHFIQGVATSGMKE
ncbi:MAG: carbohydrate ABC transporter permease [Clostridiales bacterium]|nr:carbohydrate ABC transporter permease [Clostridiales bacterium]